MRKLVKFGLRSIGVDLQRYSTFRRAVELLTMSGEDPFFVQIGANNGIDFDDMYKIAVSNNLSGIVVEPISYYFDILKEVYKNHRRITPLQFALHPSDKSSTIFRVDPNKVLFDWQHGVSSFRREHLLKNEVSEDAIVEEQVPCITFGDLVSGYVPEGRAIDILMTDTEGFDGVILGMVDLERLKPKIIKFESKHLAADALAEIRARLTRLAYRMEAGPEDTTAISPDLWRRRSFIKAAMASPRR